jgi:nicotinamide-nucleotide amidase
LITGGLGPTKDDLTKNILCTYFNCGLEMDDARLEEVRHYFETRGRELTELNRLQAMMPTACNSIQNKLGTAPGMWFDKEGKVFVSMPGVPHEMKAIMTDYVIPKVKKQFETPFIFHRMVLTVGIGESALAPIIEEWEDNLPPQVRLAYLPSLGMVRLRLTGVGENKEQIISEVKAEEKKLLKLIPKFVFGFDNDTLEGNVGKMLLERNLKIATAESCTGGALSAKIVSVPGSSKYFEGGIVSYSYNLKTNELGVPMDLLTQKGAVSEEVVKIMAESVRKRYKTDIGISASGIAGPDGGTPDKPVGTVWIAYSDKNKTIAKKLQLGSNRENNIQLTVVSCLNLIRQNLE